MSAPHKVLNMPDLQNSLNFYAGLTSVLQCDGIPD